MDRHADSLAEHAGEMERRSVHGTGDVVKRDALTKSARQVRLGRLDAAGVIGIGSVSSRLARRAMSRERGFKHIGEELESGFIDPEPLERIGCGSLQPLHELVVTPENTGIAGAGGEGERPFGAVVDGWIELADDVVEDARRREENGSAIAAVGRMADAIGRSL